MYREEHIHTSTRTHTDVWTKKQLSAVGATEQYIHINSQTTKPLFSLYLIDIVFLLPLSRSISLSCVCYCFWVDFVVIIIRYKCDLDGITSIYRVGIPISIERHHHLSIMHYKQTKRRLEKCLDALKISHRTKEPTTIKKIAEPHPKNPYTYIHSTDQKKEQRSMCRVWKEKKPLANTLKFGCETKCKHLRKLCNYQTICGADRKSKELKREKKNQPSTHTHNARMYKIKWKNIVNALMSHSMWLLLFLLLVYSKRLSLPTLWKMCKRKCFATLLLFYSFSKLKVTMILYHLE